MEIAERIAANASPHLEPNETVVAAFPAQTLHQLFVGPVVVVVLLGIFADLDPGVEITLMAIALVPVIWYLVRNQNLTVVATDRRTIIGSSGMFNASQMKEVVHEAAADVQIGPAEGFMYTTDALGLKLRVHRRFHDQIAVADERTA